MTYMAVNGSVSAIDGDTSLASAGMDFNSEEQTVRLEDGQQSAIISVPIIDVSFNVHETIGQCGSNECL